jgi:hypothetical protein
MQYLILAALLFPPWWNAPLPGRSGPVIESHPAEYVFGQEAVFSASLAAAESPQSAQLILQDGFDRTVAYPAEIDRAGDYRLSVRRDLSTGSFFPFASFDFWWEAVFPSGRTVRSDPSTFQYADDRFAWSRLEKGRAAVAWTDGSSAEAEDAAELILLALGTVSAELEAPIPERTALYLYPRLAELSSALGRDRQGWEGAVSDPASGTILIAAASGAGGRRPLAVLIPHEVTHLLLGEKWTTAYPSLPLWLAEGLAAGYEMEGRPEADRAIDEAAGAGDLIPLRALCGVFPAEERAALLAYAESKSFVAFLKREYGLPALRQAIAAYAGGADCGRGLDTAVGKTLDELETEWKKSLAAGSAGLSSAWILVAVGALLLAGVLGTRWWIRRKSVRFSRPRENAGWTAKNG